MAPDFGHSRFNFSAFDKYADRFFLPGKRVVKVRLQPKPNAAVEHQRAAATRERIEAPVLRRTHFFDRILDPAANQRVEMCLGPPSAVESCSAARMTWGT